MDLCEFFAKYSKVAIAFSGGVDSSYLLYEAKRHCKEVCAYYVKSAFQPQFELDDALRISSELNVQMKVISLDVLADKNIVSNPWNRCYYCKKRILSAVKQQAQADGYTVLLDGTNASDATDDRPGTKALKELAFHSPLQLCGLTKQEIRLLSKEAGLFTWDKPAYACLATRIPTRQSISETMLKRIETVENYLSLKGFSDFRIRTIGETARIELREQQIQLLMENRKEILAEIKKYYKFVCLDLETRNEN